MASYENIQNNELNFKNILSVAGKLKYSNILFNVDSKNFCKCCLGINSKIKNNAVINCKCSCKGHEHGTFNMEDVLRTANDKIYNKFNVNKEKDIKEIRSKDEIEISDKESVVYEPEPYGNENYIVYSYDHYNKSNESSTESIYKRLFNNIFLIDKSESDINISNNEAKKDGEINKVNIEDDLQNLNKKLNINEDLNQYEQFLTEEENECIRNIERNNDKFKRINVTTGYMGKGLLRLNRNPEFSKLVQDPLNISTNNEEELNQSTIENESTNSNVSLSSLQKSTPHIESSAASNIVIPTSKKKKVESPIIKDKKEFIDQKNLIDEKILEKIQKNRFLNKRLLKNENIFNILTNPIIKISKKKYYNYNKYYRNGILKKRNIGKILYNNYVIQTGPFRNYFSKEGHNIFNRYLYSSSGDLYLHQPYTSKYEYSSYNSINAKKLTYIKHNHPNCKIKMKPHDVVKIGKPKKALLKWNDHSFSRIPTISKKVHHFNANKYLFELNDSILTNEEEQTYECCPKKYDSVCYRKNLYKLQREILTDYIKESTAIISQKYPNIGGWGNLPDDNYKKIKDNQLTEEDDESTEEEENKELNMKNIYPKNMTLDEYLRMYEEMLENKLKKPIKKETKSHVTINLYDL
ncbi:hypothetical protein BCR36DRAFT_399813 [Piromyces finnis]|uniref:Uncharacterized protein n=1 Tax=Piromyces finnis TaxID=1754191 RepID=A0A1Y1V0G0_9FUNG|nr:hypothetical protein BCR36DRAFT_399813 [Piromyces finnis]|eukprot:ORX43759.1 hypothetical protein BCR36DRAFT_399813 [Piromyces finnis]